jgi:hypothetical protein
MGFSLAGAIVDPQLVRAIEIAERRSVEPGGKMPIDFHRVASESMA